MACPPPRHMRGQARERWCRSALESCCWPPSRWSKIGGAPLFPLSLLTNRPRSAAYLAMLAWGIAIISAFLFLSFFLQDVLGYGAARAGLAFLPYPLAIQLGVRVVRRRMTVVPARALMAPGLLAIASGLFMLSRLTVEASYLPEVLLVFLLLGLGTSLVLP